MSYSIIPVFLPHLGCPNDCVFCNQRAIAAPVPPTPEQASRIIGSALEHTSNPQIAFYGGSFTALAPEEQERYLAAAFEFVRGGQCSGVRVSTRPDCVDGQTVVRLLRYGVRTVELGAQSMDDTVLLRSRRGHTAADTVRASRLIKNAGLELILQMMTCLPGSADSLDLETARVLAGLGPSGARVYPTCVVRGSELEQMYMRGEYSPQTIEQATDICADILDIFGAGGVPVLRIGLNPTEELSDGGIICGPYHPAMGELARSRRMRKLACEQLEGLPTGRAVISVPKGRAPLMRGQKRCNVLYFEQKYPHLHVDICEDSGQTEDIIVGCRA